MTKSKAKKKAKANVKAKSKANVKTKAKATVKPVVKKRVNVKAKTTVKPVEKKRAKTKAKTKRKTKASPSAKRVSKALLKRPRRLLQIDILDQLLLNMAAKPYDKILKQIKNGKNRINEERRLALLVGTRILNKAKQVRDSLISSKNT